VLTWNGRTNRREDLSLAGAAGAEVGVAGIVVGNPVHLSARSPQAAKTQAFAADTGHVGTAPPSTCGRAS